MEAEEINPNNYLQQELEVLDGIYNVDCDERDDDRETSEDGIELHILLPDNLKSKPSSSHQRIATANKIDDEFIEKSAVDEKESETVDSMYGTDSEACCTKLCNRKISQNLACQFRDDFHELSKDEQDLVILSHLEAHREDHSLTEVYDNAMKKYPYRKVTKSLRNTTHVFRGVQVCRKMYFFIHDIGIKRYKNLVRHFDSKGLSGRTHGLAGKRTTGKHYVTPELRERIVGFIKAFANHVAVPLPGRFVQFKNCKVMKLPSSESKISVYRRYTQACENDKEKMVSDSVFYKLWNANCPYITCMKPVDDLCDICQENLMGISMVSNEDVGKKQGALRLALEHLQQAKVQKNFYSKYCRQSTEDSSTSVVYSFDFGQDVCYPQSALQTEYFKSARKCSMFGVFNEITKIQMNFLIDEEISVGKGPNSVISMLHHLLENSALVDKLTLFADSYAVQNKDCAILHYLLWRTKTKRNKKISLNYLMTGHTKFGPDRMFSLIKLKYSESTIDCFEDFVTCVNTSSRFNKTIKGSDVLWRKWDQYFKAFNTTLPDISEYHHFIFEGETLSCQKSLDSDEEKFHLMLYEPPERILPDIIQYDGLRLERKWYLFNNIRDLCKDPLKKDKVAPRPDQELPEEQRAVNNCTELNEQVNIKKRKMKAN